LFENKKYILTLLIIVCAVFAAGVIIGGILGGAEYTEVSAAPEIPPSEQIEMMERVLFPTLNLDAPIVRETHLYGEFLQYLGGSIIGMNFTSTDDFGPYTVISMRGEVDNEVVRIGFFHVDENGDLIVHLRFKEEPDGEMVLDPIIESWTISVNYPFIQLSRGHVTLVTTFYLNQETHNTQEENFDENNY